jgi:hypothetical protein
MPLFLKSKLVFIHIPRTGGTYIENLMAANGDPPVFYSGIERVNGISPQHQTYLDLKRMQLIPENFTIFTILRDDEERYQSTIKWLKKYRNEDVYRHEMEDRSDAARYRFDNHNMPSEYFFEGLPDHELKRNLVVLHFKDLFPMTHASKLGRIVHLKTIPDNLFKNES